MAWPKASISGLEDALGKAFDAVDRVGDGRLGKGPQLLQALRLVEESILDWRFGLDSHTTERLVEQMAQGDDAHFVLRDDFVQALRDVAVCVEGLDGLSLNELKEVLIHAFHRFDIDGDGAISAVELEVAMNAMGVPLSNAASERLHGLLGLDEIKLSRGKSGGFIGQAFANAKSAHDRWVSAFHVAMKAQVKRKSLDKAMDFAKRIQEITEATPDPLLIAHRYFDLFCENAEEVAEFVEVGVDASACFLAIQGLNGALASADIDVQSALAFMTFLGVTGMRMFEEVYGDDGLSADESRIFVKAFQQFGFEPSQVKRLMRRTGAQFRTVEPGQAMDDVLDGNVVMLVRGGVNLADAVVEGNACFNAGATFGASLFTTGDSLWRPGDLVACSESGALCLVFEADGLRAELKRDEALDLRFQTLLHDSMHVNCNIVHAACCHEGEEEEEEDGVVCAEEDHARRPSKDSASSSGSGGSVPMRLKQLPCEDDARAAEPAAATDPLVLEAALHDAFGLVDDDGDDQINEEEFACALRVVQSQHGVTTDQFVGVSTRLVAYLGQGGSGLVDRANFVTGMKELICAFEAMGSISIEQLGSIIKLAHDRFDADGNGRIDDGEFAAAVASLGFDIPAASVRVLNGFLSDDVGDVDPEISKMLNALQGAMELQARRKILDKVVAVTKHTHKQEADDSPVKSWLDGLRAARPDDLQDFVEVGMDAAAFGTALTVLQRAFDGTSWTDLDITNLAPFLIFLGLSGVYMRRELEKQDVKDLTADEALVYAVVFQKGGFSVQEFRELVREGGAVWEDVATTRHVNTWHTQEFSIVVRGGRAYSDLQASVGDIIGEAALLQDKRIARYGSGSSNGDVVIEPGTRLLTWKVDALQRHFNATEVVAQKFRKICAGARMAKTLQVRRTQKLRSRGASSATASSAA